MASAILSSHPLLLCCCEKENVTVIWQVFQEHVLWNFVGFLIPATMTSVVPGLTQGLVVDWKGTGVVEKFLLNDMQSEGQRSSPRASGLRANFTGASVDSSPMASCGNELYA